MIDKAIDFVNLKRTKKKNHAKLEVEDTTFLNNGIMMKINSEGISVFNGKHFVLTDLPTASHLTKK